VVGLGEFAGDGVGKKFEAPMITSAQLTSSGTQLFENQIENQTAKRKVLKS
jgi:hypothetical protein